jgi:hypothetical protein
MAQAWRFLLGVRTVKRIFGGLGLFLIVVGVGAEEMKSSNPRFLTLAHELIEVEAGGLPVADEVLVLDYLIERAVAKFNGPPVDESEDARARRFFQAVDTALIEANVILPPRGHVELWREALVPRGLSLEEYSQARLQWANLRRQAALDKGYESGARFRFFDCDLASVFYVSVAEKLDLPVFMVEVPGHNFVRWQSAHVYLNWDPNDGVSISDEDYRRRWRVKRNDEVVMGYLQNMSRGQIMSYWWVLCGQDKVRRGDEAGGLVAFRRAYEVLTTNFAAQNELAWALATNVDASARDGREALKLAEDLVVKSRRINWLETLAAAHAEVGNFLQAEAVEQEARQISATSGATSAVLRWYDNLIGIYASGCSYAEAMRTGRIVPADTKSL